MASAMTKWIGTVAQMSTMLGSIPRQCRIFLGQPYFAPGTTPNIVLHAQRDTRPVMGLHLGHGNHEVCVEHCARQPNVPQACVVCTELGFDQLVAIEVNERNAAAHRAGFGTRFRKAPARCRVGVPGLQPRRRKRHQAAGSIPRRQ